MPAPLVSFCIATYNRGPVLLECLRKIAANGLAREQFEILLVDNASIDQTADLVARQFPTVKVIRLAKNAGPVAKNAAIQRARGEFVVLLDDDAYPHPGALLQMVRHFREDKGLGAAVFDVTLPDGAKEGSAYPDVFIGAGTGLRRAALEAAGGVEAALPAHFFMQAEEYDLSFRLLEAGYSVQRFWDMPLTHLKTPDARIGQRTTRLDVRNNVWLLAKYMPEPLCFELAADWLARYWLMATGRDEGAARSGETHKQAYLRGAAEGLGRWGEQRAGGRHVLSAATVERVFKFREIRNRLERVLRRSEGGGGGTVRRVIFAELGKNMLAYWRAARELGVEVAAIADDRLGGQGREYRGTPLLRWEQVQVMTGDVVVVSNLSRVHAPARAAALRRTLGEERGRAVVDLFSRRDAWVCAGGIVAPRNP